MSSGRRVTDRQASALEFGESEMHVDYVLKSQSLLFRASAERLSGRYMALVITVSIPFVSGPVLNR